MKIKFAILFTFYSTVIFSQTFTEITSIELEGVRTGATEMADVNGDGFLDILIIGTNSSTAPVANLYLSDGNGAFFENLNNEIVGLDRGDLIFGDVDNDGDSDLIAAGIPNNFARMCRLYKNDGEGNFPLPTDDGFMPVQDCRLALEDIDNDMDLDLLVTGKEPNFESTLEIYVNNGSGIFTETATDNFQIVSSGRPVFVDVDGDGDKDIIISGFTSNSSSTNLYINNGSGEFSDGSGEAPFTSGYHNAVEVADVDGDGDEDLFLANVNSSKLYLNDGSGSFQEAIDNPFDQIRFGYAKFGDIDGDNDIDIMMSGENEDSLVAKIYLNDGSANFEELLGTSFEGTIKGDLALEDIDNDGDLDVLIIGENESNQLISKLYRNDFVSSSYDITEEMNNKIVLSPNPVINGVLTAKINCDFKSNSYVTVYNTSGRRFMSKLLKRDSENSSITIDVSDLISGMYILEIKSEEISLTQRFFVTP
tara:strand:- start:114 stop:1550 length:1437 start_codon:yes stop_codon:yes gene_type:complete